MMCLWLSMQKFTQCYSLWSKKIQIPSVGSCHSHEISSFDELSESDDENLLGCRPKTDCWIKWLQRWNPWKCGKLFKLHKHIQVLFSGVESPVSSHVPTMAAKHSSAIQAMTQLENFTAFVAKKGRRRWQLEVLGWLCHENLLAIR